MSHTDTMGLVLNWMPAAAVAFGVAALFTGGVLAAARRWRVLDRPNARSAHRHPTPTLGGIGVLAGFWAGVAALAATAATPPEWRALAAATAVLAMLIVDDLRRPLSVAQKLPLQVLAAALWLALGPRLEIVELPVLGLVDLGWWSWPATALWLMAVMNAFNFMDGIDGLTATQTITGGIGLGLCLVVVQSPAAPLGVLAAAAAAGFLVYNRPAARIFMGDVGAHALGLILGGLVVVAQRDGFPFWLAALVLGYYLYDTGYTVVRRALRGENLLQAHSQHLYQRLVQGGWSHGQVDEAVLGLNACLVLGVLLAAGEATGGWVLLSAVAVFLVAGTVWCERRSPVHG